MVMALIQPVYNISHLWRHSYLQSSSYRWATVHKHTPPERCSLPQGWRAHFADKEAEGNWSLAECQTLHRASPSSHPTGWRQLLAPTPKTNPVTGNTQSKAPRWVGWGVPLAETGSSWTSAKDNHLRPRGMLSASPHQLLTFMGHVD